VDATDTEPRRSARHGQNDCETVVGRKAWLFSDTVRGAQASANLYSLVETAKANGIEPYAYLRHVFTEIPKATTLQHIEALLPHRIDPAEIQRDVND